MANAAQTSAIAIRQSLLNIVAAQTAAWEAAGCPPTFSVDGESYDWNNWLDGKLKAIESITKQIQALGGPFKVSLYGRP